MSHSGLNGKAGRDARKQLLEALLPAMSTYADDLMRLVSSSESASDAIERILRADMDLESPMVVDYLLHRPLIDFTQASRRELERELKDLS